VSTATRADLPGLPTIGETVEAHAEAADLILYSVTTIIGVLDKPALVPWAVDVTAERTVENLETVARRLEQEGAAEAVKYIKGLRWQTDGRLRETELGTLAHALFDEYAMTGHRPEVVPELHPEHRQHGVVLDDRDIFDLRRMLDQFDTFLQRYSPEYLATEVVVFHPDYRYAGQADGFARIGGDLLILDYKTSLKTWDKRGKLRTPYPEVGLQLAAYRYAELAAVFRARRYENRSRRYYLLSPTERAAAIPVPEVVDGVAIKVTPDHCGVYPVRCGPETHEAFLYALEVARWSFNESAHVVGNEMVPPLPPEDLGDPFAGLPNE
jgi:plasmid stabilization system protein ParE